MSELAQRNVVESVEGVIGGTPPVRPDEFAGTLPGKVEAANAYSVEDRIARGMIGAAEESGALPPGGTVVECGEAVGESDMDGGSTEAESSGDSGLNTSLLNAEGSSTVYPISNTGSSYWNSNAPPSDGEYWGSNSESTVPGWGQLGEPDVLLADYSAREVGFEPTEQRSGPPSPTTVGLNHSGTGCEAVTEGLVDIGNSSGPIPGRTRLERGARTERRSRRVTVTYDMRQAARISDQTAVFLTGGKLVEYDGTDKIFENPGSQRVEDYITGRFG